MEAYERLVKMVQDAAEDVAKADGGNKAAGTRVRKSMQDIKKAAQDVRLAVLATRGEGQQQTAGG
jgi:Histone H1-like protein Hc1